MAEISRGALFGKLNSLRLPEHRKRHRVLQTARQPVRRNRALGASDPAIAGLRSAPDRRRFDVNPSSLARDLTAALERLPPGNTTISDLSADVEEMVERARSSPR